MDRHTPVLPENSGAVVNAAIRINNLLPVKVVLKRLAQPKVLLEYFDSGHRKEFSRAEKFSGFTCASDPFSLLKSALAVCGPIAMPSDKLKTDVFDALNGGVFLSAGVIGIPKGSGLGTSSIFLAACIKGILKYIGCPADDTEIFRRVLLAEQIMGTGGGWQDQAGGMTAGIKLAASTSGYRQNVDVKHLQVPREFMEELNSRFCLVYSGQRKLDRTVLREVMGGYLRSDPIFTDSLKFIHSLAGEMCKNIEEGNMEGFIENINTQTDLTSKLL